MTAQHRLIDFLGLKKDILALLGMVVLVGLGEKMAERFLPLYLMALGGGAFSVGLLNGLDNLLSALYSLPGGYASDRLGYKRALLLFNLVAMAGYVIVIAIPSWQAVILGAFLFVSWTAISLPATMDLVATVLPAHKRTMGVSLHSLVRRIPMALGPLIGGALIGAYGEREGVRLAFIVALILAAVSLVFQQTMIAGDKQAAPHKARPGPRGLALISPSLRSLLVSDILIRFCEQIPYAFVVVWCVSLQKVTPFQFGILTAVEMVTAVLVYIPVAYLADAGTKRPYVLTTFVFFTLFPVLLLFSRSFWLLVAAFVLRGLKEFGEPARKALIMDLAPDGKKAATFGLYYLIRDIVVSVAAFGGALLWDPSSAKFIVDTIGVGSSLMPFFNAIASPSTNFIVASAFGVMGTLYFGVWGNGPPKADRIQNSEL
jgi:MFS family permease